MKAMILAAGLGTRLRPLTNDRPKALVEVAGKPLLEHAITKLTQQGTRDIIINTHHFAEKIAEFLESKKNFGVHIELSHEPTLLDTGGGLNKAAHFFNDGEPFLLYNTDVLSNIDLGAMLAVHQRTGALATLAVRDRKTSRYFLFDDDGRLVGWTSLLQKEQKIVVPQTETHNRLSFMGIHIISPRIFELFTESGTFSIVDVYLRLAGLGERIQAFRADQYKWLDLGRREQFERADDFLQEMNPPTSLRR
ncbi:nucleotidyltransferase family protein [candidate division KSB1 bacterium]|nr:nucleotidyltransferase family protein [candidate division KSB1 bacterium]